MSHSDHSKTNGGFEEVSILHITLEIQPWNSKINHIRFKVKGHLGFFSAYYISNFINSIFTISREFIKKRVSLFSSSSQQDEVRGNYLGWEDLP